MIFSIPLLSQPQTLTVVLVAVTYNFTVQWCAPTQCWILTIDDANGNTIVGSIPLVAGIDLLGQYGYLGFGGALFVQTSGDETADPTFDNLGDTCQLYFKPS